MVSPTNHDILLSSFVGLRMTYIILHSSFIIQTMNRIVILSFPGNNGDTENLRTFKRCGFDAFVFRWNDSLEKLADVDGYFIGAGFSYEDRGRAGMVAARDPLFAFLHEESAKCKVIVGHCNGCQMLVESGLIPVGKGLRMCMARNMVAEQPVGFLNEWVYITPTCARGRCATSNWNGTMHIPIAHGEGRFVTKDPDLIEELLENDQVAFSYCDSEGNVSADAPITPNGSTMGIAGICNKEGNVVAMMPHAERTVNGDPYFASIQQWIEGNRESGNGNLVTSQSDQLVSVGLSEFESNCSVEIFIDTKITNNEERTVEQAARHFVPELNLKQLRYIALPKGDPAAVLTAISRFNANKEFAYVRKEGTWYSWSSESKKLDSLNQSPLQSASVFLRRDEPDMGAYGLEQGTQTGICYVCRGISEESQSSDLLEVFANPHSSSLQILR